MQHAAVKPVVEIHTGINSSTAKDITYQSLTSANFPDCIFCMSDEILTGVMRAVQESGRKYPGEFGIITISNGFFPLLYFPEITYIETNGKKLGQLAYKQMIFRINDKTQPQEIFIESILVEGGSM